MVRIPRSLPVPEPAVRYVEIRPADRASIAARVYEPDCPGPDGWNRGRGQHGLVSPGEALLPRGTVLIHGATATPQHYYAYFARYLAANGWRVITYDYRGVGDSRPANLSGFSATMLDWAEQDARAVIEYAREHYRGPVSSIGHSFGGQLLGLIDEAHDVDRAVLVAAQFGYYGHWNGPARRRMWTTWKVLVPALTSLFGYLPGRFGLGEDLPSGVAREWATWCSSPGYILDHIDGAADRLALFDRPTLALSFADDDIGPDAAVRALLATLSSAPISHERISPASIGADRIGHLGFFRERSRDTLWPRALAFLNADTDAAADLDAAAWNVDAPTIPRWPSPATCTPSHAEILSDLSYGRDR